MSLPSLRESIGALLGLVFRSRCEICLRDGDEIICPSCAEEFDEIPSPYCSICGLPLKERSRYETCWHCHREKPAFTRLRSLWLYEGALKKAITRIKFPRPRVRRRELADSLAEIVIARLGRGNPLPGFRADDPAGAAVLPVPMHAARLRKRGLSLAAEAARIVSETWGIPLLSGMLIKARRTPPQVRLARADRLENVKESFAVSSAEEIHGKILLVVDDVATTGATLNECARTLKEAGARRVYALTLARQP